MPALSSIALRVGRAGLADVRVGEDAVGAVEPAVGAPGERVERLVRVLVAPAVEQDLRRAGRVVVAVLDRNEQKIRRGADPDAAEADLDAADEVQVLDEDLPVVETSVAVGVLEDQDAILALAFRRAHRIGVRLDDPQPAAVVEREGDRLHDVRLARGERDRETLAARSSPWRPLLADRPACGTGRPSAAACSTSDRDDLVRKERPRCRGTGSRRS